MNKSNIIYLANSAAPAETPFYKKPWFLALSKLIYFFINGIPPLQKYVSKTLPFLNGRIPRLYRNEKYLEALELSLLGLVKCNKNMEMNQYWWWSFLSHAVYCADCLKNTNIMNHLISMSEKVPRSYIGGNAAYCYCRFSYFKYDQEEYDYAIRFAELAKEADDEYGEAYYLLGFYELFINEGDPMAYFSAAVERDQKILGWITHHPNIKEFPSIINELTKLHQIMLKEHPSKSFRVLKVI